MKGMRLVLISLLVILFYCLAPACASELSHDTDISIDDDVIDDISIDDDPVDNDSSKHVIPKHDDDDDFHPYDNIPSHNVTPKDLVPIDDGNDYIIPENIPDDNGDCTNDSSPNPKSDAIDYSSDLDDNVKESQRYDDIIYNLKDDTKHSDLVLDIDSNEDYTVTHYIQIDASTYKRYESNRNYSENLSPLDNVRKYDKMEFEPLSIKAESAIENRDEYIFQSGKNNATFIDKKTIYLNELDSSISTLDERLSIRLPIFEGADDLLGSDFDNALFIDSVETGNDLEDKTLDSILSSQSPISTFFCDKTIHYEATAVFR